MVPQDESRPVFDPRQMTFAFIPKSSDDFLSPREMAIKIVEKILSEHNEAGDWSDDIDEARAPIVFTQHRQHPLPAGLKQERRRVAPMMLPPPVTRSALRTQIEDLPRKDDGKVDLDDIRRQQAKPVTVREDYSAGRKIVLVIVGFVALAAIGGAITPHDPNEKPSALTRWFSGSIIADNLAKFNSALAPAPPPPPKVKAPGAPGAPQ